MLSFANPQCKKCTLVSQKNPHLGKCSMGKKWMTVKLNGEHGLCKPHRAKMLEKSLSIPLLDVV